MQRRLLSLLLLLIFVASCAFSPDAKKKKALDGGNKYFERGQFKQARLMYLNALKIDPRFGDAHYKLALTNLRLGAPGEALGNLQRTIELQPDNIDAHSKLADILLFAYASNPVRFKGFIKDIRDLSARMEKRAKGSYEELRLKAYIALADDKADEALSFFEQADKAKPNQPGMPLVMANTLLQMKRTDDAIALLKKAIEKDKEMVGAYDLLYKIYVSQTRLPEAEAILSQRIQNNPKEASSRLQLAVHYFFLKRNTEMEKVLDDILNKRTDFPDGFIRVGDFYYRLREFDRAALTYNQGIEKDPAGKLAYTKRLIEVRVAQNRPQESLDMVEKLLAENPKDPEAIAMRASLWLYAGKPEQINTAVTELQSVIAKMPENFVLRNNLGRALLSKGDIDGARVQFQDAVKFRPDYLPARIALAEIMLSKNEVGAALSAASEILRIDPTNPYGRLIQSRALMAQNKFSEAKSVLADALKLAPDQRDAKYQMAFINYKEGKFKEAEELFTQVYNQKPPDLRGLMGLTETYLATNQRDRALKMLEAEMEKFPKSTALMVAWGNIAVRGNRYDDGIKMYQKVLDIDPKNFDIVMHIGEANRLKGDLAQAAETWKKAAELRPGVVGPVIMRAAALDSINRKSEAGPLYEMVLKNEPDNLVALNNYAYYLADQGNNLDLALTYAQKAKSKAPADPLVSDTLGFVYLKKNLPQSALSIFMELTGKYPKVALFHARLATVYLQQGNKDAAKKELDEARRQDPEKKDKQAQDEINKIAGKIG